MRGRSSLTHCEGCLLSILSGTLPSKLCRNTQQHCSVMSECTHLRWLEKLVEADDKNEFHRTARPDVSSMSGQEPFATCFHSKHFYRELVRLLCQCSSHLSTEVNEKCGSRQVAARDGHAHGSNSQHQQKHSCVEEVFCRCSKDFSRNRCRSNDSSQVPFAPDGMPGSALPQTARCSCFY